MKPTSWWPLGIIGALSSIAVLNTTLFVLASRSHVSLITESPYEDSLAYDARQRDESRSLTQGFLPLFQVEQTSDRSTVQLSFAEGIHPTEVTVAFLRPAGDDSDRRLTLSFSSEKYTADTTPTLKRGLWLTETSYIWNGEVYRSRGEYLVP